MAEETLDQVVAVSITGECTAVVPLEEIESRVPVVRGYVTNQDGAERIQIGLDREIDFKIEDGRVLYRFNDGDEYTQAPGFTLRPYEGAIVS